MEQQLEVGWFLPRSVNLQIDSPVALHSSYSINVRSLDNLDLFIFVRIVALPEIGWRVSTLLVGQSSMGHQVPVMRNCCGQYNLRPDSATALVPVDWRFNSLAKNFD